MSKEASKILNVCSLKQVFTILSDTAFVSRFVLKTRQVPNAYNCNLYKSHICYNKSLF